MVIALLGFSFAKIGRGASGFAKTGRVGNEFAVVRNAISVADKEQTIPSLSSGTLFSEHSIQRAVQRGITDTAIFDALDNPLKIREIKIDHLGRPSQRFIGKNAEVVINPSTKQIISVNPTSTKKAVKLINERNMP